MSDKHPKNTDKGHPGNRADAGEKHYARAEQADATLAGDRAALYHRGTRIAITLNAAGTALWQSMDSPRSSDELARVLQEKWPGLPDSMAQADVKAFLAEMQTQGFCDEV